MKRILSFLLAISFAVSLITVPVQADTAYTQEELVTLAKDMLSIDDSYTEFEIESSTQYSGYTVYSFLWTNNENKKTIRVRITDKALVSRYSVFITGEPDKSIIYTPEDAQKSADTFLSKVLRDNYKNVKFSSCRGEYDEYSLYYSIMNNNIAYYDTYIHITVDKYTNEVVSYVNENDIGSTANPSFKGTKTLSDAENFIKDNIVLGYKSDYNYTDEKYEARLLYRLKDYIVSADDLTFLAYDNYYGSAAGGGGSAYVYTGSDSSALTPQEIDGIEDYKNAMSPEEGLNILNTTLDHNFTVKDADANYIKPYGSNEYSIDLDGVVGDDYWNCTIDHMGRITSYTYDYYSNEEEDPENIISQETAFEKANDILNRLQYGYEMTPLESVPLVAGTDFYRFKSNIIRNGYISFDETIIIEIDKEGRLTYISAKYIPDEVFEGNVNINVTPEQAYDTATEKYELTPYYLKNYKYSYYYYNRDGLIIPIYAFEDSFSVDADTGELLDYNGKKIRDNEIKEYTDLNSQWYAEYATKLAYMGCSFEDDEFRGDDPLTYKGLKELNSSGFFRNLDLDSKNENDTLTRYEFAEYLIDAIDTNDFNKYNEIYIKPFDDVDYQHTGAVAIPKALGIVSGDSFRGNDNITRGEAAAMLYRVLILDLY